MKSLNLTKNQKITLLSVLLVMLSAISYAYFTNKPQLSNVQGIMTSTPTTKMKPLTQIEFFTPVPSKTIEIGADVSSQSRSRVLESANNATELKNFYKNYFYMQDWVLIDEASQTGFYTLEFRQNNKSVKIAISFESDTQSDANAKNTQPVLINIQEFF